MPSRREPELKGDLRQLPEAGNGRKDIGQRHSASGDGVTITVAPTGTRVSTEPARYRAVSPQSARRVDLTGPGIGDIVINPGSTDRMRIALWFPVVGALIGCGRAANPGPQSSTVDSAGIQIVTNPGADRPIEWNLQQLFLIGGASRLGDRWEPDRRLSDRSTLGHAYGLGGRFPRTHRSNHARFSRSLSRMCRGWPRSCPSPGYRRSRAGVPAFRRATK